VPRLSDPRAAVLAVAAIACGVAAPQASALTMAAERSRSAEVRFAGAGCESVDRVRLRAPRGAWGLRPTGLRKGSEIESDENTLRVATVRRVAARRVNGRRTLTWTVVGTGAACETDPDAEECDLFDGCEPVPTSVPWRTEAVRVGMRFLVRRRVPRFTLRELRSDARLTLSVEFGGAYDHGYGKRLSCRRLSRYRGTCRFSWVIGDGLYSGSFVSVKRVRRGRGTRPDRITIRNRGAATLVDEYCQVTGGRGCVTRIPIRYG
jgi:hypothetical protein